MNRKARLTRARDTMAEPDASGATRAPEPPDAAFLEMLNAERAAIDAADRAALDPAERADLDFGDEREPEPVVDDADEARTVDEAWYLNMLRDLRAEITDDHPKAASMDKAIEAERKES